MAGISYYLQNKIINHTIRNTSFTSTGSEVYLALYLTSPLPDNSGTEVSGNNYSRVNIKGQQDNSVSRTFNTTDSTWAAGGAYNYNTINFPSPTGTWGDIKFWGILDAQTGGNLLYYGTILAGSGIILKDNTVFVKNGAIYINLGNTGGLIGNGISAYLSTKIIDHTLNYINYTSPGTSIYAAAYTGNPSTNYVEASGSGYARAQAINWTTPSASGSVTNNSGSIILCYDATTYWWNGSTGISRITLEDSVTSASSNKLFIFWVNAAPMVYVNDRVSIAEGTMKISMLLSDVA